MVACSSPLLALAYLLAASPGNKGRQRYAPKRRKGATARRPSDGRGDGATSADPLPLPPRPTKPSGPFPTYYTCRHSYEDTLMEELTLQDNTLTVSSPYPGLVRVDTKDDTHRRYCVTKRPSIRLASLAKLSYSGNCQIL